MTAVPVFLIANLVIENREEYRKYEIGFFPILKRHGGQLLTFDDNFETLEGSSVPEGRMVILQFPSEEAARSWWNDPEYQAISGFRRAATNTHFLTLVHGQPPRA